MSESIPEAVVRPAGRWRWAWLVPVGALILALLLVRAAWQQRGATIQVTFASGHGIQEGDDVRDRGVTVGAVRRVQLDPDGEGVILTLGIRQDAEGIARAGARFWIERPRLDLTGVRGIETLIGPKFVRVAPGAGGERRRAFVGLDEPPVITERDPNDLEIVLEAPTRGSVRAGAPVTYRQVRVGVVLSVGLSSDGNRVESRVHIDRAYRGLVCERTRFWDAGGVRTELGLSGLSFEADSIERLLTGGVALATPPADRAGEPVRTGHVFALSDRADKDWLAWSPSVPIGDDLLPSGALSPNPLRATVALRRNGWLRSTRSRVGWVLQTEEGLLGPADLLSPKDEADEVTLEVAGRRVALSDVKWVRGDLACLDITVGDRVWPSDRIGALEVGHDAVAIGDPTGSTLPIAANRIGATDDATVWTLDSAFSVDRLWHGAAVISRTDGKLVGLLIVGKRGARIVGVKR